MPLIEHAFDSVMGRRLYSLALESPEEFSREIPLPPPHFACLLAWNAGGCSVASISSVVEFLLRAGASYFVCWGQDCERVHDVIDEIVSDSPAEFDVPEDSCIMTTWHTSAPLPEALWFLLSCSWPDDHYSPSTEGALAVSIRSPQWAKVIARALERPREFLREHLESSGET